MGGLFSAPDDRDRKTAEFEAFEGSFILIEKYVQNNTRGLSDRFRREYRLASSRPNVYLNWHNVLVQHMNPHREGMGYVEAIRKTGKLLKTAKDQSRGADRQAFNEVHRSVDRLIDLRSKELDPKLAFLGFVIWGGDQYNNHKAVVDAWKQFSQ